MDPTEVVNKGVKRAQEPKVSESEPRLRRFIDKSNDGVWRLDFERPISLDLPAVEQVELLYRYGYLGEVNQALADLYGFDTPAEVMGLRLEEVMPRELPTSIPRLIQAAQANYRINDFESIEQDRYGNRKVFQNNFVGEIEDGKLLRVWGTARDITQQKQLEEETRLRSAMFEQVPEGCVIVEALSEKVVYSNAAFTRITGYTASDIPGIKLSCLQGADTDSDTVSQIREAIASQRSFQSEILNYKKDGTPFWNLMSISPIRDTEGIVTHYVGILADITEQKRIQKKLHDQRLQLTHVARVAAMGELTAALAHELNQPLTAIMSNAQAALRFLERKNPEVEEVRQILQDIVADDKRAGEVLQRIRRLMRRDHSQFERLDINQLVEEVQALISNDLAIKQVKLSPRLTPNLPASRGDPVQLQQVILNLIINAYQALSHLDSAERQVIVATKNVDDQAIEISVTDNGSGIEENILDQIFQPFFSTKEAGMGMGLAINRTIIEAHGGRLWAENNPGKGAVFRITLPIAPGPHTTKVQ